MKFFANLRLGIKLPLVLVSLSLVALTIMGIAAFRDARNALLHDGEERLDLALDTRKSELETWTREILSDVTSLSQSEGTAKALREFVSGWDRLGEDPGGYLRREYIAENPNPAGKRQLLDAAGDVTDYTIVHRRYHPGFVALQEHKGYYDIFLVDVLGNVVYTMFKEDDFGTNLLKGPYKDTGLAEVVRGAIEAGKDDAGVRMSDFAAYAPSNGDPAAFVAAPVRTPEGRVLGVIAFQIPVDRLNTVMQNGRGVGATGQVYLVGGDGLLRSDLRDQAESSMLRTRVDGPAVQAALTGESGMIRATGVLGADAMVSYQPMRFMGLDLAMIAEEDRDEMIEPAWMLGRTMILHGAVVMTVLGVIAWVLAQSLARPMVRVTAAMSQIAEKDYATVVPGTARKDEVGLIARALERFRDSLAAAAATAEEGAFKGAAFEGSSASLMMMNADFEITYVNGALNDLFHRLVDDLRTNTPDFDPDRIVGRNIDVFHAVPTRVRHLLADPANLPYHAEIKVGATRFSLDINEVNMAERGHIGFVVEWRDISVDLMNRALLGAIDKNQATAEFDASGNAIAANANMLRMLGLPLEQILGRRHDQLVRYNPDLAARRGAVWDRLVTGESIFGRFVLEGAPGREAIVDGGFSPVLDRSGKPLKIVLIGADVTEAQQSLRSAETARAQMEAAQAEVVEALRIGLRQLSEGDLTSRIEQQFTADYEELRADFNEAVDRLCEAMQAVIENATSIRGEAQEISNAADDLSRRTEKQAATLEETAAALDQLTASVRSAAAGATEANRVVTEARGSAEQSGAVVAEAVAAMGEIESSSEKISKIISVIDDIAFQTNLLALNAGVEAARAGEAGRGFAVVASEVRALAQRSSEAAREIDVLISASSGHVQRGVGLVDQAGAALKKIVASVGDISARVSEIAVSAQEQSAGLAEINIAVNQLDQVTQQNAAMFEETTAASHAMTREAEALTSTTGRFRVGGGGLGGGRVGGGGAPAPARAGGAEAAGFASRRGGGQAPAAGRGGAAVAPRPAPLAEEWEEL